MHASAHAQASPPWPHGNDGGCTWRWSWRRCLCKARWHADGAPCQAWERDGRSARKRPRASGEREWQESWLAAVSVSATDARGVGPAWAVWVQRRPSAT
eukprot:356118-Chlamydomonas_euryale.AAC.10